MKDTPRDGVTVYDDARFFKKFYIFHVIKMTNWVVFIRLKKSFATSILAAELFCWLV